MDETNLRFGPADCHSLQAAIRREWIETNGLGGWASSTIIGLNTRRYHGLLVAAIIPPVGRLVTLAKLEEAFIAEGQTFALSANQYPGVIHPQGYTLLEEFRLDPFPTFVYGVNGCLVEKRVAMIHGRNLVVISYYLRGPLSGVELRVRPLIAFRDYHSLTRENPALCAEVGQERKGEHEQITLNPYPAHPPLILQHSGGTYHHEPYWYHNFEYFQEQERGLDFREDLFSPGEIVFFVAGPQTIHLIASTEPVASSGEELVAAEEARRERLQAESNGAPPLVRSLWQAADTFLVRRGSNQQTLIAGYHWFTDWGRDTMIALPGLCLVRRRYTEAQGILKTFARYCSQGMLPNRFPDAGKEPEYNTADASLWFFEAVRQYLAYTGDTAILAGEVGMALVKIIEGYRSGTRYGIHMDKDGLIEAGEEGVQLTWMDAKVGDWVVTPRQGKAVEIQALWYNALRVMETLTSAGSGVGETLPGGWSTAEYRRLANKVKRNFLPLFWQEEASCLYDSVNGRDRDPAIRPNQIFTLSLPFALVSKPKGRQILLRVGQELLTPYGLRTLAPSDVHYRPHYLGDQWERDSAYHQGTVWPWLLGHYILALLRVFGNRVRSQAQLLLDPFAAHLAQAGLGSVSEIFDADPPHTPRGCIAQAWSVGTLLEVCARLGLVPKKLL